MGNNHRLQLQSSRIPSTNAHLTHCITPVIKHKKLHNIEPNHAKSHYLLRTMKYGTVNKAGFPRDYQKQSVYCKLLTMRRKIDHQK